MERTLGEVKGKKETFMVSILVPVLFFLGVVLVFRSLLTIVPALRKKRKEGKERKHMETKRDAQRRDEDTSSEGKGKRTIEVERSPVGEERRGEGSSLARVIDHTLLRADASEREIADLCREAIEYRFCSICVSSFWVPFCAQLLEGSDVLIATVVGFPLGTIDGRVKVFETQKAIERGASEIDMVINLGALKSGKWKVVEDDIREIASACSSQATLKVILETASLSTSEKVKACQVAQGAGAAFVKTSTGFGSGGSTVEDVALMRSVVGAHMGVKASGGIRSYEDARRMVEAGANRLGTSAGLIILSQEKTKLGSR